MFSPCCSSNSQTKTQCPSPSMQSPLLLSRPTMMVQDTKRLGMRNLDMKNPDIKKVDTRSLAMIKVPSSSVTSDVRPELKSPTHYPHIHTTHTPTHTNVLHHTLQAMIKAGMPQRRRRRRQFSAAHCMTMMAKTKATCHSERATSLMCLTRAIPVAGGRVPWTAPRASSQATLWNPSEEESSG